MRRIALALALVLVLPLAFPTRSDAGQPAKPDGSEDFRTVSGTTFPVWIRLHRIATSSDPVLVEIREDLERLASRSSEANTGCVDATSFGSAFHTDTTPSLSLSDKALSAERIVEATVIGVDAGTRGSQPSTLVRAAVTSTWRGEAVSGEIEIQIHSFDAHLPSGLRLCVHSESQPLPAIGDRLVWMQGSNSPREKAWGLAIETDAFFVFHPDGEAKSPRLTTRKAVGMSSISQLQDFVNGLPASSSKVTR